MRLLTYTAVGFFSCALQAQSNYLRLYFMPSSPVPIEWESPRALVDSTISASFNNRNHPISHVSVEIRCETPAYHVFTGAVSRDRGLSTKYLFQEKIGLSIMATAWAGRLEDTAEVMDSLVYRGNRRGMLSALTLEISPEHCQRLVTYHTQIEKSATTRLYGFAARPRHEEGAGCSAFAASYVEVPGLLTPALRAEWSRTLRVPLKFMTVLGQNTSIEVRDLINDPASAHWANASEPHMSITLYDPDLMHAWVDRLIHSAKERAQFSAEIDSELTTRYPKIQALKINHVNSKSATNPIFAGPANMVEVKPGLFVRGGVNHAPDGSFELPAD